LRFTCIVGYSFPKNYSVELNWHQDHLYAYVEPPSSALIELQEMNLERTKSVNLSQTAILNFVGNRIYAEITSVRLTNLVKISRTATEISQFEDDGFDFEL